MGRIAISWAALIGGTLVLLFGFLVYVLFASGEPSYWEGDIAAFERRDISNPPEKGAVLFIGGRDVRLRESLGADMMPFDALNRGFGGARIAHLTHYAARIVKPYEPSLIVMMAGDEDLADVRGRRPEDVLAQTQIFLAAIRAHGVDAPVLIVSVPPAPMRMSRWPGAKRTNALLRQLAHERAPVHFIDLTPGFFTEEDELKDQLFRWDGMSLSKQGYAYLARELKPKIREILQSRRNAGAQTRSQ
jgi:lysophospholipase L1-like esterase